MKKLVLLTLLLASILSHAQKRDSLDIAIDSLGWHSYEITTNYVMNFHLKRNAEKIISLKSPAKIEKLLKHIDDSTKTVAIHAILTRLIEPDSAIFYADFLYKDSLHKTDSSIIGFRFFYNKLEWYGLLNGSDGISAKSVDKIKSYWHARLKKKKIKHNKHGSK